MRYIEIDGERVEVHGCKDCPCYDYGERSVFEGCKHPSRSYVQHHEWNLVIPLTEYFRRPKDNWTWGKCPLREVE